MNLWRTVACGCGLKQIDSSPERFFLFTHGIKFNENRLDPSRKKGFAQIHTMARQKSHPLQRTTKRKSQDRDRVLREGLRTSSNKRLRLQSPAERPSSSSKKGKKKKGMVFDSFSVVQRPNVAWLICRNCGMIERTVDKQWIKYRGLVSKV